MLHHFPFRVRPAIAALWAVDGAMAAAVAGASHPALAAIKLAWWREALVRLDHDPAPPEPRLRAVAERLIPLGVGGAEIAVIAGAWSALLDQRPDAEVSRAGGEALFAIEGRLLGVVDPLLRPAGALTFLTNAMRRNLGDFAEERAILINRLGGKRVTRRARPITLAARLAARDVAEKEGTPARALALIAHRLTGVIARDDGPGAAERGA